MVLDHLDTVIAFVTILLGVSLLIMVITQLFSSMLNLRGRSLLHSVKTLLETADVDLDAEEEKAAQKAKAIAKKVLYDKLISDSWFKRDWFRSMASTVRREELELILNRLVDEAKKWQPPADKTKSQNASPPKKPVWVKMILGWLVDKAKSRNAPLPKKPVWVKMIPGWLVDKAKKWQPPTQKKPVWVDAYLSLSSELQKTKDHIKVWFDRSMDRASERFVMHTRVVTVILSLITALVLHLDAFTLYDKLSTDSELRASIVASSESMLKQAEGVLSQELSMVPSAYTTALDDLRALPDSVIISKIDTLAVDPIKNLETRDNPFISRGDAEIWLDQQLKGLDDDSRRRAINQYNSLVEMKLTRAIDQLKDQALAIKADFDSTEFKLIPEPYPSFGTYFEGSGMHLWGTLAMAALLSLGAPFWFNLLKQITALRPILAGKEDKERQDRQKKEEETDDPGQQAQGNQGGQPSPSASSNTPNAPTT